MTLVNKVTSYSESPFKTVPQFRFLAIVAGYMTQRSRVHLSSFVIRRNISSVSPETSVRTEFTRTCSPS